MAEKTAPAAQEEIPNRGEVIAAVSAALAEELGYNPSYLSQKFIQETGISFMEYLHRVRVDRSCHLLQTTDMRVSRIAAEVGYEDIKYFNKIFKQHLAVTPREFRTACK